LRKDQALTPFQVAIRPYQPGDAPLLYEAARESIADISPWMPWCHPGNTLEESKKWHDAVVFSRYRKI
jgi:hypothetical protein